MARDESLQAAAALRRRLQGAETAHEQLQAAATPDPNPDTGPIPNPTPSPNLNPNPNPNPDPDPNQATAGRRPASTSMSAPIVGGGTAAAKTCAARQSELEVTSMV